MKKIFVGAFGGAGTRVVMEILKKAGYFVGEPYVNGPYDYRGKNKDWVQAFDRHLFNGDSQPLRNSFDFILNGKDSWALKEGHIMWAIDDIKKWYPSSEFIYVMRNPIDNAMSQYLVPDKDFKVHQKYGGLDLHASIEEKSLWCMDESIKSSAKADYVVNLEELCYNTEVEIGKLLDYTNIVGYDVKDYVDLVITPKSIGRGKDYYDKVDVSKLGY